MVEIKDKMSKGEVIIDEAKELSPKPTCSILEQVAADGKTRKINLYNLDTIIFVGYREGNYG